MRAIARRYGYYGEVWECAACHTPIKRVDGRWDHVIPADGDWAITAHHAPDSSNIGLVTLAWLQYEHRVLAPGAPPVQRIETRRAFYAGAHALLGALLTNVSDEEEMTITDEALIPSLQDDINRFLAAVMTGEA